MYSYKQVALGELWMEWYFLIPHLQSSLVQKEIIHLLTFRACG